MFWHEGAEKRSCYLMFFMGVYGVYGVYGGDEISENSFLVQ